jgi:hypothetical protein
VADQSASFLSDAMSARFLAAVSLAGLGFDLFGGLYLAYDLLGGARGPLGIVTRAATYGLVFTIGYTIGLGFPFGTITGLGLGVLLGLEYRLHQKGEHSVHAADAFALLRGLNLGVAASVAFGLSFGIPAAILAAIGLIIVYRLGYSVADEYAYGPTSVVRLVVVRNQAVRVATIGLAILVSALIARWELGVALSLVGRLLLTTFIIGLIVVSGAPRVEAWADSLPARRLGLFGLLLILIGFLLDSVQFWVTLVS